MMPNMPFSTLGRLARNEGWAKVFGDMEAPGAAFLESPVAGRVGTRASQLSSRGFAGTSNRNPLQPEFSGAGPGVMEDVYKANTVNPRVRKVSVPRHDAEEAAAAIRGDHVDNTRLGKLRRLLLETKAGPAALAAVGGTGLGAMMAGGGDQEMDPETLRMLMMQQQGYGGGY